MAHNTYKTLTAMALAALLAWPAAAQSLYPATMAAQSFNISDVKLLPSRFADNMRRDSAWMASIPAATLLHNFQTTAGVYAGKEGGYMTVQKMGGWESMDCELRGHITGHMLSALSLMWAATGSEALKAKADSVVAGLREVQDSYGTGYLSAWPEELINRNMLGKSVWAPWYTLHKILAGLIDQYQIAGNAQALDIAKGMGDWAYNKLKDVGEEQRQKMIRNEFGGINEAFYNLWALTGDDRYQWLARFFYHNDNIDPLREQRDDLGTKHTNTFIPKVIAEARNYELTSDQESRRLTEYFWQLITTKHAFVTGSVSQKEHFFDTAKFSKFVNGVTGETCCTYNMLKLSHHLFQWNAEARVADYYEGALVNHILGQQDPESGMVCYFLPLLSGSHKVYSTPWNSFWCCVGSGFENHAKYAEGIYYHNANGLYVNLFIPSQLTWADRGLTVTQTTDFPASGATTLTFGAAKPVQTTVWLRYPQWAAGATVKVNGKSVKVSGKPGSYIAISRKWADGDRIEADFAMQLALRPTPDNPDKAALVYGPVVLAGLRGTEGMQAPAPFSNPALYNDYYTYDYHVPAGLKTTLSRDLSGVRHEGGLTFTTADGDTLRPLYDTHRQRYVVYWDLTD